jgi:hypothetical protein
VIQKSLASLAILALVVVTLGLTSRLAIAAIPTNDDITNATALTTFPFTDRINTAEATVEPDEPADCFPITHTVWYKFDSGGSSYVLSVNSAESDYATRIALYTGAPGSLQVRYCADAGGVTLETAPGETWYMQVTGVPGGGTTGGTTGGGSEAGSGNLVFYANATLIVPITVDLAVNPNATVNKSGTSVVVTGTIACSRTSPASVSITVTQIFAGRLVATAGGSSDLSECGPSVQSWSAVLENSGSVRFGPGVGTFDANAGASDDHGSGFASASGKLKLKRS